MTWRTVCSLQLSTRHVQGGYTYLWKMTILEQFSGIRQMLGSCGICEVEIDIMTFRNKQSLNPRLTGVFP